MKNLKIKIDINEVKENETLSEVHVEGSQAKIIQGLANCVYTILRDLNMKESIDERMEVFHGAMLISQLTETKRLISKSNNKNCVDILNSFRHLFD